MSRRIIGTEKTYTVEIKRSGQTDTDSLSGLPKGLSCKNNGDVNSYNHSSVIITGTPAKTGIYTVKITATNKYGSDTYTHTLKITDSDGNYDETADTQTSGNPGGGGGGGCNSGFGLLILAALILKRPR